MTNDYVKCLGLNRMLSGWVKVVTDSASDETTECTQAIYDAAEALIGYADDRAIILFGWLLEDLDGYFADDDPYDPDEWDRRCRLERREFLTPEQIVDDYDFLVVDNNDEGLVEFWAGFVRDWMKPSTEDLEVIAADDPEYNRYLAAKAEYERLARKFGDA